MLQSNLPWIESPFFKELIKKRDLTAEQKAQAAFYHENGFIKLGNFIPHELVDQVQRETQLKAFDKNFKVKTQRDSTRIQDFWKYSEPTRQLASYQPILDLLEMLYGREAIPFQTLNFCVGTQQRAHSDTIHFSSLPAKYMCGVWVALEDVTDENGPLFYYPGSHRLPEYDFSQIKDTAKATSYENYREYEDFIEEIMAFSDYKKEIFHAKKGDALLWSSNIIHGGMPVLKEGSTRWSQVTHYFFKDCYYYTPMLSNMVTDELFLRNNLINIKNNEKVTPSYNGEKLNSLKINKNKYILNNGISIVQLLKMFGKSLLGSS